MDKVIGIQSGAAGATGVSPVMLSRAEFAGQFETCSRALWCVAAGVIGDRAEAEDIVQQAALIAMERLETFDARGSFLAWMVKIVKYTALNERRKRQRRRTAAADPAGLDLSHTAPGAMPAAVSSRGAVIAEQSSFDDQVVRALGALDETARACLLLRTVLDMPYRDVALTLDIPEGTAMSHVHRARKALREALGGDGKGGGR